MANGNINVDDLTSLVSVLRGEKEKVQQRLSEIDEQLRAVETTINIYKKTFNMSEPPAYINIASELKGKKQLEAVIHIASKNNGKVRVTDAKRLLIEAGIIRKPKNALSMLYTVISRSGKFIRVNPGEYELITPEQTKFA